MSGIAGVESLKGRMKHATFLLSSRRIPAGRQLVVRLLVLALVITGLSVAAQAYAAVAPQLIQQPAERSGPTQPIDLVIVLDDSGSMATCWPWPREGLPFGPPCRAPSLNPPSDPNELRYSAARLLLQLLDDDDRLAIVRFDSVAEGVGALGTLQRVGDGNNRIQLSATLQPPTDYLRRGYTRIDLGLGSALDLLSAGREPGRTQYVLLLTDGEPSEPANVGNQRPRIVEQLATFQRDGVLVFPVVLCNANAGCPAEFLRQQFPAERVAEAATAQDLLRVLADVLTQIKPDRSLITNRNPLGNLQFTTRDAHGVRTIALVTPRGELSALRRDDIPMLSANVLNDPNIDLNVLTSDTLAAGTWVATTADRAGFAVVRAAAYPQLLNPPPSLANSPASLRYYPAGKPPLLIARANGPDADEPLFYNGDTPMTVFGQNNTRALLLTEEPGEVRLQLGADTQPLQLVRSFQLEARADLPQAQVFSPLPDSTGLLADGRARLQVGFDGNAGDLAATVWVFEGTRDGIRAPVYQANMRCDAARCTDEEFRPVDGRRYQIFYVIQGRVNDVRFSDWAQADLALDPAVYLRGLPAQLDLGQMPAQGWTVELGSGTLEPIGSLAATLTLRRAETGEVVTGVGLDFVETVPADGTRSATFFVSGLETLRPGRYEGEVGLVATNPAGLPMTVNIRPAPVLPVTIDVPRPASRIEAQAVDFGEVLFDTSPNFRLDRESLIPVAFSGRPFPLTATLRESSCANLTLVAGDVAERDGRLTLPLRLTSAGPVLPTTCRGVIELRGPNRDYDVTPTTLEWQARVASVEWSIVSGDLYLGDLQDAGARAVAPLLVRFNGKTPFVIQGIGVTAAGSIAGGEPGSAPFTLTEEHLDIPAVEVAGPPNEAGLYEVPLTLIARQDIPGDYLRSAFYTGQVRLTIAGLPNDVKAVNFNFRSPSPYQRYLAPVLVPIYSMPWVLCTGPLTLLILLVVVARLRGRNFDESEIEQAAVAATRQTAASISTVPEPAPLPSASLGPRSDVTWGSSEWGSAWGSSGEAVGASRPTNGSTPGGAYSNGGAPKPSGDPWSSSW